MKKSSLSATFSGRPALSVPAPLSVVFRPGDEKTALENNFKLSAFYVLDHVHEGECGEIMTTSEIRADYERNADGVQDEYETFSDLMEDLTAMGGYFWRSVDKFFRLKVSGRWIRENDTFCSFDNYDDAEDAALEIVQEHTDAGKKAPSVEIVGFYHSAALFRIYRDLNENIYYGKDVVDVRFPYFSYALYLTPSGNIGWTHYGSSANSNTLKDLLWTIQVIFRMTPEAFLQEFIPETKSSVITGVRSYGI